MPSGAILRPTQITDLHHTHCLWRDSASLYNPSSAICAAFARIIFFSSSITLEMRQVFPWYAASTCGSIASHAHRPANR
ncbi:hypothetical protein N7463_003006 [Penicillium fimorum]|uniref:Uncharacterized protein n=1 Tax=Penicillium fimorum TaxID=1882269 RepID=A0A9X0C9H4_9EURO|nr:hypothetical protein N7463_003006 [Penicillium fimorum]